VKFRHVGLLCLSAIVALSSCVSAPRVSDPSGVDINVALVPENYLLQMYGSGPNDGNPYRTPGSMITGKPHEFVRLGITIASTRKATIYVDGIVAKNAAGEEGARFYPKSEFSDYTAQWSNKMRARAQEIIQDTYVPDSGFVVSPGKVTYYAVLIGKKELPRPLTVTASVGVDTDSPRQLVVEVAEKK